MIGLAIQEDLAEIDALFQQAKEQMVTDQVKQWTKTYPDKSQLFHDIINRKCYKLVINQEIVCVVSLFIEKDSCWIKRLATSPKYAHYGFASRLYQHLAQLVKDKQVKRIYAATNQSNQKMQAFFKKQGFVKQDEYEEPSRKAYGKFYVFCKELKVDEDE